MFFFLSKFHNDEKVQRIEFIVAQWHPACLSAPLQFKGESNFYFIPKQWVQCISNSDKGDIVYSEKISYFFTSDEYEFYFFTVANRGCFDILKLTFFPKRSGMHRSCLTLRYGRTHVTYSKLRHSVTSLYSSRNAKLHVTSVRRQLQAAFLNHKLLLIHPSKWHYKPFSRCKPRLRPILYPLNALS